MYFLSNKKKKTVQPSAFKLALKSIHTEEAKEEHFLAKSRIESRKRPKHKREQYIQVISLSLSGGRHI